MTATASHRLLVILGRVLVLAVILIGTELGVRQGVMSPLFFSSPTEIFHALQTQWASGSFLPNLGITVFETLLGLVAGSLTGMALGLILPQMRIVSKVFEPFLMVLNGIPVIVIAPLFILWLGGLIFFKTAGAIIHLLLVIAVIVVLVRLFTGRSPTGGP